MSDFPNVDSPAYLVIGATGGIGRELCHRLVDAGARLMLMARSQATLGQLSESLAQPHVVGDAADWQATADAVGKTVETFGGISGAVNLAGSILLKPAHLTGFDDFQETIRQNMTTAFGLLRSAAPAIRKSGGGSIVLTSSAAADIGLSNHEAVAAAKAGVAAMARSAAATYAGGGVRVNAVAPGLVQTAMTEKVWGNERAAEASRAMHPLGRLGTPQDIASLIAWLLHPDQTWITAQTIAVDGGLSTIKTTR